jgi:hypothetical protein
MEIRRKRPLSRRWISLMLLGAATPFLRGFPIQFSGRRRRALRMSPLKSASRPGSDGFFFWRSVSSLWRGSVRTSLFFNQGVRKSPLYRSSLNRRAPQSYWMENLRRPLQTPSLTCPLDPIRSQPPWIIMSQSNRTSWFVKECLPRFVCKLRQVRKLPHYRFKLSRPAPRFSWTESLLSPLQAPLLM